MASKYFKKALESVRPEITAFTKYSIDIAVRLDELRKAENWTQKEFANKLGKAPSEVNKWLSGMHNFTLKTMAQLELLFGTSVFPVATTIEQEEAAFWKTLFDDVQVKVAAFEQKRQGGVHTTLSVVEEPKKLYKKRFKNTDLVPEKEIFINYSGGVAKKLKRLLKDKGWTQKALANQLSKSPSEVSKWLSGTHNFTLKTIALLETLFDTSLLPDNESSELKTAIFWKNVFYEAKTKIAN